jgi:thioredoxin-disulfide reductase
MYDITIVGAGPAGITAAIYAARKKLKVLVLTKDIGGQAAWSSDISNYTGFQFITGPDLAEKFREHLGDFEIELKEGTEADCIIKKDNVFHITTKEKEKFESKTVIIATGRKPRRLGIPGEDEFKNKGVTWCATCDGPLFSGKDVAVIGGGNSALDSVLQLIPIAKKIYLVNINEKLMADQVMVQKAEAADNVEIINNARSKEILGDTFVQSLKMMVGEEERTIDVQGIFIEIGSVPVNKVAICQDAKLNEWGEIVVNERCETNVPGLYAAGDVTNVPEKQIIVAAGQGCIACLQAFKYLSTNNI